MPRRHRTARRLLVGDTTYVWQVGHDHDRVEVPASEQPRYRDCRAILILRRLGESARLHLVFRDAPDRLVPDGAHLHSGAVGTTSGAWLNLHEPGTARALLDQALGRGASLVGHATTELDGWPLFDAVVARRDA
jgi:hypothetical protein